MVASVEVVDTIDRIDPVAWDDLAGDRVFARQRWLRLAEAVLVGHEPRYVVVRRDGRYAAAAVCALGRRLQNPSLQRPARWLLRLAPYLRFEIPITFESGLLLRAGEDAGPLRAAVGHLADRERALFVRLDHLPADAADWTGLASAGYQPFPMWPETMLDLRWPSFDAYLAALPSRKRAELNRVRRRADATGLVAELHVPSAKTAPELRNLVGEVLARHAAIEEYHPDLFGRAGRVLGDDMRILVLRHDDRIVGCAALLRSGDEITAKWLGLDYARTRNTQAYARLLLACVEAAISLGARRLRLGATAYETKRHFGVAVEPRFGAVSARIPAVTRLVGRALGGGGPAVAAVTA
jgi:predicted N-acyltransferase